MGIISSLDVVLALLTIITTISLNVMIINKNQYTQSYHGGSFITQVNTQSKQSRLKQHYHTKKHLIKFTICIWLNSKGLIQLIRVLLENTKSSKKNTQNTLYD